MILFTVTPRFERHFRPRRPNDSLPVRPLIDVMLYWCCTTFGGLFASAGLVAIVGNQFLDVPFESSEIELMIVLAAISPVLFVIGYRSWRKLNHGA